MPVEIREINIKINVAENESSPGTPANTTIDRETLNTIVTQCVEQVMEIISKKDER